MVDWNNELILSFLEMYKNEPVLWDPNHSHNKDKKKTGDAWLRISECIDIPINELKKKKESLMATFRSHLRKKNVKINSGASEDDLQKPIWFAYEFMEEFLRPVYNYRKTLNSQTRQESMEDYDDDFSRPETSTSSDFPSESRSAAPQEVESSLTMPQHTIRRRHHSPEHPEVKKQIKNIFSLLNTAIAARVSEREDDEYDLYGKLIAKKIRKLPEHERELIMYDIDGIFINRHRKHLSSSLFPSTDFQNQSSSALSSADIRERPSLNTTLMYKPPSTFSSNSTLQSVEPDLLTQNTSNCVPTEHNTPTTPRTDFKHE